MTWKQWLVGGPQPPWLRWVFALGALSLLTRLVLNSSFGTTAVFYVLVPYIFGLVIYIWVPPSRAMTKAGRAGRHIRSATIFMLATSAILFEGFLCVLFAFPIYLIFAGVVLALLPPPTGRPNADQRRSIGDTFRVSWVPVLVVVMSLEGTHPSLSFERDHSVTRTRIVEASVAEIQAKLAEPIVFTETRSRFLSLFPLPHRVEAGTLGEGDVHTSHFRYRRWPVGNTHDGAISVELSEVGPERIRTSVLSDDTYFSHYLTVKGTQIDFAPRADGTTEVSLTIHYRRDLDPAWYFGPLQRRAISESADYLIEQLATP